MSETLPRMILERARLWKGRTALRRKEEGIYRDIPWETLESNIRRYGRALLALGLEAGDRVAVMAPNGPEWVYADLGAMAAGGTQVPVYHTEGVEDLIHILRDSQSRFLFLHFPPIAEELLEHLDQVPQLESIVLFAGGVDHPKILSLENFLAKADGATEQDLDGRLAEGTSGDLASIVYTSGTTGLPKGAMLTHGNFLANIDACRELFDLGEQDECLSFLPLSHVFERVDGYYFMLSVGVTIAYAESIDTVPANLQEVKPTVMISVPRLFEKMYARIMERVLSGPWLKKQIFFGALKAGKAAAAKHLAGEKPGPMLQAAVTLAKHAVFEKLKGHLGGRVRFFISGGAPLGKDIAEFFLAADIPIYEGYGLTETTAGIVVNTPGRHRLGTVGRAVPGTELRIAEDGEILIRGPGVFKGYWKQAEKTREALREDGWFLTGDIGELDPDGFLAITDRKKDLIVTAGGKNIAPQNLENIFKTDKFLANAMVYGDRKPFLTALLVPNFDTLEKYAQIKGIDFLNHCDLVNHPRILDIIRRRIDRLQLELPSYQKIKRFTLLSRDFSKEDGEVTPTLKIKRNVVSRNFQRILDGMYLAKDHGIHDSGFCVVESTERGGKEGK